jgi:hypothetical protein
MNLGPECAEHVRQQMAMTQRAGTAIAQQHDLWEGQQLLPGSWIRPVRRA